MRQLRHSAFAAAFAVAAIGFAFPLMAQPVGGQTQGQGQDQVQDQVQGQIQTQDKAQEKAQGQGQDQTQKDQTQNQDQDRSPGYWHGYGPGYRHGMMGPGYGPGMMRPGYGYGMMAGRDCMMDRGYGGGYGPGMMRGDGPGYGPGMMNRNAPRYHGGQFGQGNFTGQVTVNLSTDDVKTYFDRLIAAEGNPRLKVGDVKEKDADTIVADIVTKDNSLVQRFAVDRHTGFYKPEEE